MKDAKRLRIEVLKSIPYEKPVEDLKLKSILDITYPTKISIFDHKCSGCGFAIYKVGDTIYNNWVEAVEIAQVTGCEIIRECSKVQVEYIDGTLYNLTLTEVIVNGCEFWNFPIQLEKYEIPDNAEEMLNEVFAD